MINILFSSLYEDDNERHHERPELKEQEWF